MCIRSVFCDALILMYSFIHFFCTSQWFWILLGNIGLGWRIYIIAYHGLFIVYILCWRFLFVFRFNLEYIMYCFVGKSDETGILKCIRMNISLDFCSRIRHFSICDVYRLVSGASTWINILQWPVYTIFTYTQYFRFSQSKVQINTHSLGVNYYSCSWVIVNGELT